MRFFLLLNNRPCPLFWVEPGVVSATEGEAPPNCWGELGTTGVAMYLFMIATLSYGVSTLVGKIEFPLLPFLIVIGGALAFVILGLKISFVILAIILFSIIIVKLMPILENMLQ
jgi:hypothetical protein